MQVLNGAEISLLSRTYRAQSPDKPYSLSAVVDPDTPTHTRHELWKGDQWINDAENYDDDRQRCELRHVGYHPLETSIWFSRDLRVMADTWKPGGFNILTQFIQNPPSGEAAGQNSLNFQIEDGIFEIYYRGDTKQVTKTRPRAITAYREDWRPRLGKWVPIVVNVRFSKARADGVLKVWLGGVQVVDLSGIVIGFNNDQGPYSKMGIYRSGWEDPIVVEWANPELTTTGSLADRIANPLPTPA